MNARARKPRRRPVLRTPAYARIGVTIGICGPSCAQCGGHGRALQDRRRHGPHAGRLWRYMPIDAAGCPVWDDRVFCGIACWRAAGGGAQGQGQGQGQDQGAR